MKTTCIAAALALVSSGALADTQIGNVVQPDFTGATGTRTVASASVEELHFNRDVFTGETVKTPADGSTVVRFQDSTQIQIGHGSTVVLDKFVYDPQASAVDATITFSAGVFRFISGTASDKAVVLTTPTTTLGIRGTTILIDVGSDGSSDIGVVSGSVEVKPCGGGSVVTLSPGQAVRVSAACNGTDHISLSEVPVDATVSSDFGSTSPAASGSPTSSHQSNVVAKGGTEGFGNRSTIHPGGGSDVDPPGPDHDGPLDP